MLRGARQTGKTAAVRELGSQFELFVELNLERFEDLTLVRSCGSVDKFLAALASRLNLARFPERTLLFFDEIQESAQAIRWLRFLREDHPDLFVIAAGSFLEVRLEERGFSFPVGRVTFRTLRPCTFSEFLGATGHDVLAGHLQRAGEEQGPVARPLHEQALQLLREYLLVGGMPEAVVKWGADHSPASVRRVHSDLVQTLAEDMQKYGRAREVHYLEAAFENLRHHYGLRFRYENFAPGYRSQLMKQALSKLESAMLIRLVWPTSSLALPLKTRARAAPKLLPLDIGLAHYSLGAAYEQVGRLEQAFEGRAAEMFVGLELMARHVEHPDRFHFWVAESSRANAEVDYLMPVAGFPVPIEVKSGASGSLKSLHQFLWRSGLETGIRFHSGPFADERHTVRMADGELSYRLLSVPLYLAEHMLLA